MRMCRAYVDCETPVVDSETEPPHAAFFYFLQYGVPGWVATENVLQGGVKKNQENSR